MRIAGEVKLHLGIDRRWYVVEASRADSDSHRVVGRPDGYLSHKEASRWRALYRLVRRLQLSSRDDTQTNAVAQVG